MALAAMHEARAMLADVAAGDASRVVEALERLERGFSRVSLGLAWNGAEL